MITNFNKISKISHPNLKSHHSHPKTSQKFPTKIKSISFLRYKCESEKGIKQLSKRENVLRTYKFFFGLVARFCRYGYGNGYYVITLISLSPSLTADHQVRYIRKEQKNWLRS